MDLYDCNLDPGFDLDFSGMDEEDFGLAIALRNYAARFFGAGATTQGIIEYPNKLTAEQAKEYGLCDNVILRRGEIV